jgi:hypothetical protein
MSLPCLEYREWLCFRELNHPMAPTANLTMKKKTRKNLNVKQNLNACIGHKSLTLSDVETPMMEIFK